MSLRLDYFCRYCPLKRMAGFLSVGIDLGVVVERDEGCEDRS